MENDIQISSFDDKPMQIDHLFKLIIIGDLGVGKTSLILKFTENSFSENPSLSVNFKIKLKIYFIKLIKKLYKYIYYHFYIIFIIFLFFFLLQHIKIKDNKQSIHYNIPQEIHHNNS